MASRPSVPSTPYCNISFRIRLTPTLKLGLELGLLPTPRFDYNITPFQSRSKLQIGWIDYLRSRHDEEGSRLAFWVSVNRASSMNLQILMGLDSNVIRAQGYKGVMRYSCLIRCSIKTDFRLRCGCVGGSERQQS